MPKITNPPTTDEKLKQKLDAAINAFNLNRVPILKHAFEEGGDTEIMELENRYDTLRDAYFEILKRELDRNNSQYEQLMNAATKEADELKSALEQLETTLKIIQLASQTINAVGRILITLGI